MKQRIELLLDALFSLCCLLLIFSGLHVHAAINLDDLTSNVA